MSLKRTVKLVLALAAIAVPATTASAGPAQFLGLLGDDQCISYQASTGEQVYFCDADLFDDAHPTGTGYIDPFLRVGRDGTGGNPSDTTPSTYSSGWNTDARHQDGVDGFNDYDASWSEALAVGDILMTNQVPLAGAGSNYARFRVDINQRASEGSDVLSLNQMILYNCPDTAGPGSSYTSLSVCGNPFFDLFGSTGDFINFDYRLYGGSGSGDVDVFIQNNAGFAGPYISLLDGWGCGSDGSNGPPISQDYRCGRNDIVADNDGFQEWTTATGVNPPQGTVPEPASLLLLGSGLSAVAGFARRRGRKQKDASNALSAN